MAELSISDHAVLRVAAWSTETAEGFAAPDLAGQVAGVADRRREILTSGRQLADDIHDLVPAVADRVTRSWLLAVRRRLHSGSEPLPDTPPGAALPDTIRERIEREAAERVALAEAGDDLRATHDRVLAMQVDHLRVLASEPQFLRALAVARPDVDRRWEQVRRRLPSNRSRYRRLENTVFRFLAGACGRATPRGAWAGIVPVTPAEGADGLEVREGPPGAAAVVRLDPFRDVLSAWRRQAPTNRQMPLRPATTLHELDGRWWWERCAPEEIGWFSLEPEPLLASVVRFWDDGEDKPAAPLIAAAEKADGETAAKRLGAAIDHLLDIGVLVVALDLPTIADDPWEALDRVAGRLPEPLRESWTTTVAAVREELGCLESSFHEHTPEEVRVHVSAVHAEVAALLRSAGLPPPAATVIELDTRLPHAAAWNNAVRRDVAAAVAEVLGFHGADGAAERYRRATVEALPITESGPAPLLPLLAGELGEWAVHRAHVDAMAPTRRGEALRAMGCDERASEERWERILEPHHRSSVHEIDVGAGPVAGAGSAGSMVLVPGCATWAGWGRPQPGMFAARFAELRTQQWTASDSDIEIVGSDPQNPNAAVHPSATRGWIDPHGAGSVAMRDLQLEVDRSAALPWLHVADDGPRRPIYVAPTVIGRRDPCSRLLRTLAMAHGWELVAWGFPVLDAELERWHHLPRLVLAGGTVLSAERWIVRCDTVAAIAAADSDADRYEAWRAVADRLGLPRLGLVRRRLDPGAPAMLVATESPLAVRSLFDRLPTPPPDFVVTEVPPADVVVDTEGGHHLAELAVTWQRSPADTGLPS